jgi:histone H3/H4
MSNRNNRNSLMNRSVFVSVLVAVFVLVGLASPVIAQASTDAVLILHFDEGSGTIANDESGHGNDGTIYGATWTTGVSGKALEFDGSNDYVDCGYDSSLDITDAITVEAWVNAKLSTANQVIVDKYKPGVGGYMLDVRSTGNFGFLVIFSDGGDGIARSSMTTNEWIHLVGVYNGIGNTYLYINGNLTDSDYDAGKTTLITNDKSATIGYPYTRFNYFNGAIDEVAIYNRALSPEEINAHYLAKRAGGSTEESTPDLINSVSTCIDALKRNNIDTLLIEQSLENAQDAYDSGNHDEAFELAQNAHKMADDAYDAQQHIESAESEIDGAKSIGAEVKEAEAKLKEAKDALNKGNYEYARDWADDASELAKHASIGSVQINDLKALATKYDQRTVVISGTIRDIETVYGEGYTFALDDGSGMISVAYQGSLGDINDGDKVTASGIFEASTGTLVADTVQKSGVGGGGVPGFEVIFAIAGLLIAVYFLKRK